MNDVFMLVSMVIYFLGVSFLSENLERTGKRSYIVISIVFSIASFIYASRLVHNQMVYLGAVLIHLVIYAGIKTHQHYKIKNRKKKEIPVVSLEELSPYIREIEIKLALKDEKTWTFLQTMAAEYCDEYWGLGDGSTLEFAKNRFKPFQEEAFKSLDDLNTDYKDKAAQGITLAFKQYFPGFFQFCYHYGKKEKQC